MEPASSSRTWNQRQDPGHGTSVKIQDTEPASRSRTWKPRQDPGHGTSVKIRDTESALRRSNCFLCGGRGYKFNHSPTTEISVDKYLFAVLPRKLTESTRQVRIHNRWMTNQTHHCKNELRQLQTG